jgi:protein-S-isoprenylcysteine O-methyltransferase Ste14
MNMKEVLQVCCVALYAIGPGVGFLRLLRQGLKRSRRLYRITGWRWYIPSLFLPLEWLLPPLLILLGIGEIEGDWLPARFGGLALAACGAAFLVWAAAVLGRHLVHEAAIIEDHALVMTGPYRFVRHPVYSGYLLLLVGTGLATLNVCVLLLWPLSLVGILIQAASEEKLLRARFAADYECYVSRVGQLLPSFSRRATCQESLQEAVKKTGRG